MSIYVLNYLISLLFIVVYLENSYSSLIKMVDILNVFFQIYHLICSGVPPDVALVTAQAASFLVLNSALLSISISIGIIFASITI